MDLILRPISSISGDHADTLLADFIQGFVRERFSQTEVPNDGTMSIWHEIGRMVFEHRNVQWMKHASALGWGFGRCVSLTLFSYSALDHPWPGLSVCRDHIKRWVDTFGASRICYGVFLSFLKRAGRGLLPDPALEWLSNIFELRKDDKRFWQGDDNGEDTAAILNQVLEEQHGAIRQDEIRIRQVTRITDVLLAAGVRRAAQIQQLLAKDTGRRSSPEVAR